MSKRVSEEERVIAFFESSHQERAAALFNVIKAVMKRRLEPPSATPLTAPIKRRKRRSKAELAAAGVNSRAKSKATDFPGEEGVA